MRRAVPAPRVKVLGLGNVLMGDDALGPWVLHHLESLYEPPDGVTLEDLGTPGLDLVPHLSDADVAILVDTVKAAGPPGTLRVYRRDEILAHAPQARVSPHDPALVETLLTLDFSGSGPREVVLVGIVPGSVEKGTRLTPAVSAAVAVAVDAVVRELEGLGHRLHPRRGRAVACPWWASAPGATAVATASPMG